MNEKKICIAINADTTNETVEMFEYMYERFLKNERIVRADVYYVKSEGLISPDFAPATWPLQLYTDNIQISVYNVTAGYGGTGPHGMKKILDMVGFKDTEKVLYQSEDKIEITFYKE